MDVFLLASSFFSVVDDAVVGGCLGIGGCGCDEEEGISVDVVGLMGRWIREYGWEVFSCDEENEEERKEEERLIRTIA